MAWPWLGPWDHRWRLVNVGDCSVSQNRMMIQQQYNWRTSSGDMWPNRPANAGTAVHALRETCCSPREGGMSRFFLRRQLLLDRTLSEWFEPPCCTVHPDSQAESYSPLQMGIFIWQAPSRSPMNWTSTKFQGPSPSSICPWHHLNMAELYIAMMWRSILPTMFA